jgi:hypothetical protein
MSKHGRPYELTVKHVSGNNAARMMHGVHPPRGIALPVPAEVPVSGTPVTIDRPRYPGEKRYHLKPNPNPVTLTVSGIISIPDGPIVAIQTQREGEPMDAVTVLTAEVQGQKVKVSCREIGVSKPMDNRKANISRLRRNTRYKMDGTIDEQFYVWTRDQYRFTIKKA